MVEPALGVMFRCQCPPELLQAFAARAESAGHANGVAQHPWSNRRRIDRAENRLEAVHVRVLTAPRARALSLIHI